MAEKEMSPPFCDLNKLARWYVYELADPHTGQTFYVGKGTGSRIDIHEREAQKGVKSRKTQEILRIKATGASILKRKVAQFWCEQSAYDHETDLILEYGLENLTNVLPGGQVAWERRQSERKQRQGSYFKKLTDIQILEKEAGRFAYWLIQTNGGRLQMSISPNTGDTPMQKAAVAMMLAVWNGFVPGILKRISLNEEWRERAIKAIQKYGVLLTFESKLEQSGELVYG